MRNLREANLGGCYEATNRRYQSLENCRTNIGGSVEFSQCLGIWNDRLVCMRQEQRLGGGMYVRRST